MTQSNPQAPSCATSPGQDCDPCPKNHANCPMAEGKVAITTCLPSGTWNTTCQCMLQGNVIGAAGSGGVAGTTAPKPCGNGAIEPALGEDCDGVVPAGVNCMSLGMGTGPISCDAQTCKYDTSLCQSGMPMNTGGNGGM